MKLRPPASRSATEILALLVGVLSLVVGLGAAFFAWKAAQYARDIDEHAGLTSYFASIAESALLAATRATDASDAVSVKAQALSEAVAVSQTDLNDAGAKRIRLEALSAAARSANSPSEIAVYRRLLAREQRDGVEAAAECDTQCKEDRYIALQGLLRADQAARSASAAVDELDKQRLGRYDDEIKDARRHYRSAAQEYRSIVSNAQEIADERAQEATRTVYDLALRTDIAGKLRLNSAATAVLGRPDGTGLWILDSEKRQAVVVTAISHMFDPIVRIVASTGEELARNADPGSANVATIAILPEDNVYLVQVMPGADEVGRYELEAKAIDSSGSLTFGTPARNTLDRSGGARIQLFQGEQGKAISLDVRSSDFDTVVQLFSSTGEQLARNDDNGRGTNSTAVAVLPRSEEYFVQVKAFGDGVGSYSIELNEVPEVELGQCKEAELTALREAAVWQLRGETGQTIRVDVTSEEFDTVTRLVAPSGEELAWDDDGGEGTDSLVIATLPNSGVYFVHILPFDDSFGTYCLMVTIQ